MSNDHISLTNDGQSHASSSKNIEEQSSLYNGTRSHSSVSVSSRTHVSANGCSIKPLALNKHQKLPSTHHKTSSYDSKIRNMLDKPLPQTTKATNVDSIVADILTAPKKPTPQKYVVMPFIEPPAAHNKNAATARPSIKYFLVNATPSPDCSVGLKALPIDVLKKLNSKLKTPVDDKVISKAATPALTTVQPSKKRTHYQANTTCCVISSTVDTMTKWLNCNRDVLHKTLFSVTDQLKMTGVVAIMLLKFRKQPSELATLKWVGIALMILAKHMIIRAIGTTGKPIPKSLYNTWNSLCSFFTIFEGGLKIAKADPSKDTDTAADTLSVEDDAFKEVVETIFTEYNRIYSSAKVPTTSDLHKLAEFIETLEDCQQTILNKRKSTNDHGITSVLDVSPQYVPPVTRRKLANNKTRSTTQRRNKRSAKM